jgi:hypothetical protein
VISLQTPEAGVALRGFFKKHKKKRARMKQTEAKSQITSLWLSLPEESRNESEVDKFAIKILKERPDLTSFRCVRDRRQIIKDWLMQHI